MARFVWMMVPGLLALVVLSGCGDKKGTGTTFPVGSGPGKENKLQAPPVPKMPD